MQVTQFGCGGFVIGLVFCHTICDGLGAAQFLNAVGELARGLHNPTIEPLWHRHFAPSPPPSPSPPPLPKLPPTMPSYKLEHATVDIPMHRINNLKQDFQRLTGLACSSFEIVAAGLWTSRARAIDFESNAELKLVFFANCRQILDPPLPAGFYGNCFFPVTITASYESLRDASLFDVVKMIQDAKTKLPSEFGKYLKGDCWDDPFAPPLSYRTLFISEWGRLGFNQVDFGWGPPVHVVPIQGSSIIPVGIVGYMPLTLLPNKGIRLMTCINMMKMHFNQILQLDEATGHSALDAESERVVAHGLSTIKNADVIVVEKERHETLSKADVFYASLLQLHSSAQCPKSLTVASCLHSLLCAAGAVAVAQPLPVSHHLDRSPLFSSILLCSLSIGLFLLVLLNIWLLVALFSYNLTLT
ncbi:uncharacterized protein DS421_16g531570 [Arachis hypogaea]|nr:uncharacterized protein DS421_16g531570 [Arachis hypogaea]